MAEKMQAMVLKKLAPIETRPLKLMLIDKPAPKRKGELLVEIGHAALADQTFISLKATGKSLVPLLACLSCPATKLWA